MLPCRSASTWDEGAPLAKVGTGLTTIHSVGLRRGELLRGVEAGLERGVASAEDELRGVWGLLGKKGESVGVQERVCRGEGEGDGLVILGGGTGLQRASMSFSLRGK